MKLYIKNMVCDRCKMVVKAELEKLGLNPVDVELGEVEVGKEIDQEELNRVSLSLAKFGFELLSDKRKQLSEQIKTAIIELVHYPVENLKVNLSTYLSGKFDQEYGVLSTVFSELENQTIEKYFIRQKIERVKELLTYGEKSLSEIAYLLNYSSVAHLSAQFKKVSEQTPSQYKLTQQKARKTLDTI